MINSTIQRTLVITNGDEAGEVYELFAERLQAQQGPRAAIAHLTYVADSFANDLVVALANISPTNLATKLQHQGWQLAQYQEVVVILLFAAADSQQAQTAVSLSQELPATIRKTLGISTNLWLIWLAPDPNNAQLERLTHFRHNTILLSCLNEVGLYVPVAAILQQTAADFLWLFVTSSLHILLENDASIEPTVLTVGLSQYKWSQADLQHYCLLRWLTAVFDQWLAKAPGHPNNEAATTVWLQQHKLLPNDVAQTLTAKLKPWPLPNDDNHLWEAPWPWELADCFHWVRLADSGDSEQLKHQILLAQQGADELLITAHCRLRDELTDALNTQPIAVVDHNACWLHALSQAVTNQYETLLGDETDQEERQAALADERGLLEAQIGTHLEAWPRPNHDDRQHWLRWLRLCIQPWRWPRLIWLYWQLRQMGQQLSYVLLRQAEQRRKQVLSTAVRHTLLNLNKQVQHWLSHVEEIGEMVAHLRRSISSQTEPKVEPLPFWPELYKAYVTDAKAEAQLAANGIGGLGTQLQHLDDAILEPLRQVGLSRLSWLDQLTAVDLLTAHYPTAAARQQWWQIAWQEAAPLWPFDETQIAETERSTITEWTVLAAAAAEQLLTVLPEQHALISRPIQTLEIADHERLILLRFRKGLPLTAFTQKDETQYEKSTQL
ncbi:MAG: hypothetical protein KDE56_22075 [Anaerolineales bacterium]|nr:hypothetical protein [Anaerolineales bacterium]